MSAGIDLTGTRALITGAGRGIGRAIAEGLAASGASVVANDVRADELQATCDAITSTGATAHAVVADIADEQAARALADSAFEHLGGLDLLVNNAAVFKPRPFLEMDTATFDSVMNVNLRAVFVLSQAVCRRWVADGTPGNVVVISSISAVIAQPAMAHYAASKSGVERLSKVMAVELAAQGIRVNCIAPGGPILSDYVKPMSERPGFEDTVRQRVPMGRAGEPEEVVGAVQFLASPLASYITGTVITVDGGLTLNK